MSDSMKSAPSSIALCQRKPPYYGMVKLDMQISWSMKQEEEHIITYKFIQDYQAAIRFEISM